MALSHVVRIPVTNYLYTYGNTFDTTSDKGVAFINGDDFDGIEWVKIEVTQTAVGGTCEVNGVADGRTQLQDITGAAAVGSEVSLWNESYQYGATTNWVRRSAALGITSFASGYRAYSPMIKASCISSITIRTVAILIGVSTTATKWAKYVDLGWPCSKTGTTYGEGDNTYGPKRWNGWDSTAFQNCTQCFHYATLKTSNAAYTASCKAVDVVDLVDIGEVTTTSTAYVGVISASASLPSFDGDECQTHIKSSNAAGVTSLLNSVLILPQTGSPTSSQEDISMTTYGQNNDTSTSYAGILVYGAMVSTADYPQVTIGDCYYGGVAINANVRNAIHYGTLSDYVTPIGTARTWTAITDTLAVTAAFASPFDLTGELFTMYKYAVSAGKQKNDFLRMKQTISYPAAAQRVFIIS